MDYEHKAPGTSGFAFAASTGGLYVQPRPIVQFHQSDQEEVDILGPIRGYFLGKSKCFAEIDP